MLRLFKAFSNQPRLAVVTRTMYNALGELFHFSIIFLSIFLTYAFMGMALLGRRCSEFATFGLSLVTLFKALQGDYESDKTLETVGRPVGFLFICSFTCICVMLLLGMLIAIIMDIYSQSKADALSSEPLWSDCYTMTRRAVETWQGKRLPLNKAYARYLYKWGDAALSSEKIVFPQDLLDSVPDLAEAQALRAFHISLRQWAKTCKADIENSELLTAVHTANRPVKDVEETNNRGVRESIQELVARMKMQAPICQISREQLTRPYDPENEAEYLAQRLPLHQLVRAAELRLAAETRNKPAEAKHLIQTLLDCASYVVDEESTVLKV